MKAIIVSSVTAVAVVEIFRVGKEACAGVVGVDTGSFPFAEPLKACWFLVTVEISMCSSLDMSKGMADTCQSCPHLWLLCGRSTTSFIVHVSTTSSPPLRCTIKACRLSEKKRAAATALCCAEVVYKECRSRRGRKDRLFRQCPLLADQSTSFPDSSQLRSTGFPQSCAPKSSDTMGLAWPREIVHGTSR